MKTLSYSIITAIAAFAASSAASAQNIEESLTVEGRYTPEIIRADRLPLLPAAITLSAPESRLDYEERGVTADFAPDALPLPATGWRTSRNFNSTRGYLDMRLGSWLNSSLSAGIAAINTPDTKLSLTLQHNSTSLWQAWTHNPDADGEAARRFRYDETLGLSFSRHLAGAGTLAAEASYHLGYFNYYGSTRGEVADGRIKAPTQTINDAFAGIRWHGEDSGPIHYSAGADVRHFAYRAFYAPFSYSSTHYPGHPDLSPAYAGKGNRETAINAGGSAGYDISESSAIEAEALYSGAINTIGNNVNRFRLRPAYTLRHDNLTMRIGAELAVVGAERTRVRIAPDVRFTAKSGITAFTAALTGGTSLRTLAWAHMMDYYSDPTMACTEAAYTPIEARLGLQFNPGGKWTFGIDALWRTTLDEMPGGVYQAFLNADSEVVSIPATRLHGFSVSVNAGYDFCREFAVRGNAAWQPQHGNTGVLNGFDRPEFTLDLSALSRPVEKLSLALAYRLRARRELTAGNISRLDFNADFAVTDRISVGAEINNLLNRRECILPGLPLEGLNAAAGVQLLF